MGMTDAQLGLLILFFVLAVIGLVLYFMPTIIARTRNHPNATAITVLNLLLGWSFVGWVVALVWAFTNDRN